MKQTQANREDGDSKTKRHKNPKRDTEGYRPTVTQIHKHKETGDTEGYRPTVRQIHNHRETGYKGEDKERSTLRDKQSCKGRQKRTEASQQHCSGGGRNEVSFHYPCLLDKFGV